MHPSHEDLRLTAAGHHTAATTRVVRHLLAGCPTCSAVLLSAFRVPVEYDIPDLPEHLLQVIEKADLVAAKLLGLSHPHRILLLSNRAQFRNPPVIHRLVMGVYRLAQAEPREALLLAALATETADALDSGLWRPAIVTDARAGARIARGNVLRLLGDPVASEEDFCFAEQLMENGSGDRLLRAEYDSQIASLRLQTHGPEHAIVHLQKARRTLVTIGETTKLLPLDVRLAEVHARSHDFGKAIALLKEVREKSSATPGAEILHLGATINLARFLTDANLPLEALTVLQPVADRGSQLPRSLFYSLLWTKARLDRQLTLFDASIRQFGRLYACYESEGLHRDALLVAIDFAETLLQAERWTEALQLLGEVSSRLEAWEYLREGVQRWASAVTKVEERVYGVASSALAGLRQWQAVAPPPYPPRA